MNSFSSQIALLSGLIIFCGACYLVATRRRPTVLAAYLVLSPVPMLISLIGGILGLWRAAMVIAASPDVATQMTTADFAAAFANSLLGQVVALIASVLSYFVIALGLFHRALQPTRETSNIHSIHGSLVQA